MEEDNILQFKLTVDGSGLKDFESKSTTAFSNVRKGLLDLTGLSTAQLRQLRDELGGVTEQFNNLAKSLGVSPSELKQVVSLVRELRREQNAASTDVEKSKAEQMRAAQNLHNLEMKNVRDARRERSALDREILNGFNAQERELAKLDKLMTQVFAKTSTKVKGGFAAALTPGQNYGTFSNILGGFGGGGRVGGSIAMGLDGGLAAGGGGAAMLGGLAAGAAVAGILVAASAVKELTSQLYDAGKAAIVAAGDYEVTRNSFIAFSGSADVADKELAALHQTAKNTPGLSMVAAETGARNLRALGFEAETARGLVSGLAKQKLLSGADESAVQRVIVNLTQLSAGSSRASQDLREIFHALPSLRKEFFLAFNTLDPQVISKKFSKDSEGTLKILSAQLEKSKGAQAGLNDAVIKFGDAWTTAGRQFGAPILEPLTKVIKNFTSDIGDNESAFTRWGNRVGNIIDFIGSIGNSKFVSMGGQIVSLTLLLNRLAAASATYGGSEIATKIAQRFGYGADPVGVDLTKGQKTKDELDTERANAEYKRQLDLEKAREQSLSQLKGNYDQSSALSDSYYKIEEAKLKSHLTNNKQEELQQAQQINQLHQAAISTKIAMTTKYYDAQIQLNAGNDDKIKEIEGKKNSELSKLNADLQSETLKSQLETAQKEREIAAARREAQVKALELSIQDVRRNADQQTFEITRGLDKGTIATEAGYEKLRQITDDSYNSILKSTRDKLNLQLQDETLTSDAISNLREEERQAELQLADDHNRALLALDDAYYQKKVQDIQDYYSRLNELHSSQRAVFDPLSSFFSPSGTVGRLDLGKLDETLNPERNRVQRLLNEKQNEYNTGAGIDFSGMGAFSSKISDDASRKLSGLVTEIGSLKDELKGLDNVDFPENLIKLDQLGKDMASGKVGAGGFDQASKMLLEIKQRFEDADLASAIAETKELIKLASGEGGNKSDAIKLNSKLETLQNATITQGIRHQAESIEQYDKSLAGLNERIAKLRSGDIATVLGVQDQAQKNVAGERIKLLEDNIELEYRLAHIGEDSADRYRNAWLNAIYDIKKASEDAKVNMVADQQQIANQTVFNADVAKEGILKAMAGAKGYTEIFTDGFLSITEAISSSIGGLLDKATQHLGAFGHAISQIATQLLTMITNRLMMRLLDLILPSTGGGIGPGGTPNFGLNLLGGASGVLFGGGGTAPTSGGGGFFGNIVGGLLGLRGGGGEAPVGSAITPLDTLTGQAAHEAVHAATGGTATKAGGGILGQLLGGSNFSWGAIGKTLGAAAPLLGFSLGSALGGKSLGGSILGGIGGLAGGLAVGVGTGTIGATGSLSTAIAAIGGPLAATGILAAIAVPLLVGGWLLGRNKQRRADETTRAGLITDALGQLDEILKNIRTHKYSSGQEAIDAAQAVRDSYQQSASQLKDSKTRRIALQELSQRIDPKISQIRTAAAQLDKDKAHFNDLIPEFATGGIVPGQIGSPRLVLAHGGEIIANLRQQTPALMNAASEAGIPGVRGSSGGGNGNGGNLHVEVSLGTKMQNELFVNGAKSPDGYAVLSKQSKQSKKFDDRSASF